MNKVFLNGFLLGMAIVGLCFATYQMIAVCAGELNIDFVIDRQLDAKAEKLILFNSGVNQEVFAYKTGLMREVEPEVVVLGSSRAMQVREQFFARPFINLGGAFRGVTDLEDYASFLSTLNQKPKFTIFFVDPWWFNPNSERGASNHQSDYPNWASLQHFVSGISLLREGNWINETRSGNSLGIYSMLREDGYSYDGSYHYKRLARGVTTNSDHQFGDTINRMRGEIYPFEWSAKVNTKLVQRACAAINKIVGSSEGSVVIAPPFAEAIWSRMQHDPNYGYIKKSYEDLSTCLGYEVEMYLSDDDLNIINDCEFVDGYHGGDNTYARILNDVSLRSEQLRRFLDVGYISRFIEDESGYALGLTRHRFFGGAEPDFLGLGCTK